jgi:hypothetical protein
MRSDLWQHSTRFLWMPAAFDGIARVVFAALVGVAILLRRRSHYHKRLMLLARLSLLRPAYGRLTEYGRGCGNSGIEVSLLCAGSVLACVVVDKAKSRRLHPAIFWGGASAIGMDVATYVSQDCSLWPGVVFGR